MRQIKMWLQLGGAIAMAVLAALTDSDTADRITPFEWTIVSVMAIGAFGVQIVPNMEEGVARYAKGVVSFLTAALPPLGLSLAGGLTQAEVISSIVIGMAAVGLVTVVGNPGYVFATKRAVNASPPPI